MHLLICVLKDYRLVEGLLLAFVEAGITGATVLEGRGMGQMLGMDFPLFANLRGLFPGSSAGSHVLFSVMPQAKLKLAYELLERTIGPLTEPGTGIAFSLPLDRVVGLAPEIA